MADNNSANNDSTINGETPSEFDSTINGETPSEFDSTINGETPSEFFDSTEFPPLKTPPTPSAIDVAHLHTKISELAKHNSESETRVTELTAELAKLRAEKDSESERSESTLKAAEEIAKHAAELETQVARLQHDVIAAVSDASDSDHEIRQLKDEISVLRKEKEEVEAKAKVTALKLEELTAKPEESDNLISGFKKKIEDRDIDAAALKEKDEADVEGDNEVLKVLKENLPVIGAVTAGVVLVGGVMWYVRHCRN